VIHALRALVVSAAFAASPVVTGEAAPRAAGMINLSCVEALVSIEEQRLAGVFSFISEKDGPAAFADLIVHNKKSLKKYLGKLSADRKAANGISSWDHDALQFALGIYDSPLGATVEAPGKLKDEMQALLAAPVLTLEQVTAARRKA
jgi:hypothetical protein